METVQILPQLYMLSFTVGQAYLWLDPDKLTLIDTGPPGSAAEIASAIRRLGRAPAELRDVVLTHFHGDHVGSAADLAGWGAVMVCAHRLDAPMIRGAQPGPPPVFDDAPSWERELYANLPTMPPAPAVTVDRVLDDGDTMDFAGGAEVLATPGHTDGSIAIRLSGQGVLFTGDGVASVDGAAIPGVFNIDRVQLLTSFDHLASLDTELVCVGHGPPLTAPVSWRREAAGVV